MTSFTEFLVKRDINLLREYVSYANQLITEAEQTGEAPAQLPWWRKWGKQAMKYAAPAVAGLSLLGGIQGKAHAGEKNPTDNKPVSNHMGNSDGGFKWIQGANGSWERVPVKPAGDPLKNFADEGDSDASGKMLQSYKDEPVKKIDNTAKYAKILYDIKKGTLDPEEFKNSPDYKTAKAIAEKGSPASSPVADWDAAANLVQTVKKLAPDTDSGTGTQYKYNTPQSDAQGDKWVQAFKNVGQAQSDTEQQIKDIKAAQESGQKSHDAFMAKWKADNERQKALFGERPAEQEQAKVTDGSDVNFPTPVLPKLSGSGVGKVLDQHNKEFDTVKAKFQDMGRQFKSNPKSYDPKNPDWQKFRAYNPNLFGDDYRASQNQVQKYIDAQNFKDMMRDTLRGGK
jgi:hypothetical protein